MNQKIKPYRNKKLTQSAKGKGCTLNIPNVCKYNTETTVWAHYNFEGGKMGGKTDDLSGGYACYNCHSVIDGHIKHEWLNPDEKYFYMGRSMARSLKIAIDEGVL